MKLAFELSGQGPPVLLMHGLFASSQHWREVAAALAGHHRVYNLDLRNHGRSPRSTNMSYSALADDVLELIEGEGLQRPHLIGHCIGGKVAMALALSAPYAVGGLSIIDVAPDSDMGGLTHPLHANPRSAGPALAHSLHGLGKFPNILRYLRSDLELHAVVGALSGCVPGAQAALYQPMFPRSRIDVIENAGHWIHTDNLPSLVACLAKALGTTDRNAGSCALHTLPTTPCSRPLTGGGNAKPSRSPAQTAPWTQLICGPHPPICPSAAPPTRRKCE